MTVDFANYYKAECIDDLTKTSEQSVGQIFTANVVQNYFFLCKLLKIQMTYEVCLHPVVYEAYPVSAVESQYILCSKCMSSSRYWWNFTAGSQ